MSEPLFCDEFFAMVSASVEPPETKKEKAARLIREKRIEELLAELDDLGWEPPERDYDYYQYDYER